MTAPHAPRFRSPVPARALGVGLVLVALLARPELAFAEPIGVSLAGPAPLGGSAFDLPAADVAPLSGGIDVAGICPGACAIPACNACTPFPWWLLIPALAIPLIFLIPGGGDDPGRPPPFAPPGRGPEPDTTPPTTTPEPASLVLIGAGLAGMIARKRRRRQAGAAG